MSTASQLLTTDERRLINESVRAAEAQTSAEIVPVVATASGRYDRAEDIAGLWLGIAWMVSGVWLWPTPTIEAGSWGHDPVVWRAITLAGATLSGFLIGAIICSRVAWMRRLFTPMPQMRDEVRNAAASAFFDHRVHHTQAGGGLLIYISLFERMAVILADRQILTSLGQPAIDELCQSLTQQLHNAGPALALQQIIGTAGAKLSSVLPRAGDDVNELPDALVTI